MAQMQRVGRGARVALLLIVSLIVVGSGVTAGIEALDDEGILQSYEVDAEPPR